MKSTGLAYLWVVLCIASVEGDCLEIEAAVKIDSCDDVPSRTSGQPLQVKQRQQECTHCNVGTIPLAPVPTAAVPALPAG